MKAREQKLDASNSHEGAFPAYGDRMDAASPPPELLAVRPDLADVSEDHVRASALRNGLRLEARGDHYVLTTPTGSIVYGLDHRGEPEAALWHCCLFLTMP